MRTKWIWISVIFLVLVAIAICRWTFALPEAPPGAPSPTVQPPPPKPATPAPVVISKTPPPGELWKELSGEKALEEAARQIELGPRVPGTPEIEIARGLIVDALLKNGWEVERQQFTHATPRGPLAFTNLIARFSAEGKRPVSRDLQRALVCTHYDTKRFSTIRFLAANGGAAGTGLLIELSRVLALHPALAAQVELVFFDGSEAVAQPAEADGLHGSRHYAGGLRESGRAKAFRFGLHLDRIGDRDLGITLLPDSPPFAAREHLAAAEFLGLRPHYAFYNRKMPGDQASLIAAGIPVLNLSNFETLYWHTADDTLDKLSAESLQKVGAVTVRHLVHSLR